MNLTSARQLIPIFLTATSLATLASGCWWPETASMRREALGERCTWMGTETRLFAEARDKGTSKEDALKQASVAEANEPQQARDNRQEIGVPSAADDIREIVHQVYELNPKGSPDDVAQQVASRCNSSIPQ